MKGCVRAVHVKWCSHTYAMPLRTRSWNSLLSNLHTARRTRSIFLCVFFCADATAGNYMRATVKELQVDNLSSCHWFQIMFAIDHQLIYSLDLVSKRSFRPRLFQALHRVLSGTLDRRDVRRLVSQVSLINIHRRKLGLLPSHFSCICVRACGYAARRARMLACETILCLYWWMHSSWLKGGLWEGIRRNIHRMCLRVREFCFFVFSMEVLFRDKTRVLNFTCP